MSYIIILMEFIYLLIYLFIFVYYVARSFCNISTLHAHIIRRTKKKKKETILTRRRVRILSVRLLTGPFQNTFDDII